MIVNISNPKTKKTYATKIDVNPYVSKKVGDEISLDFIGISGKGIITGGSTKEGFPMVPFLEAPGNKKVLLSGGIAFKSRFKGEKKRRTVHGKTVSDKISQVNIKILEIADNVNLDEKFPKLVDEKNKKKVI